MSFKLGKSTFAIECEVVREVLVLGVAHRVAGARPHVRGVVNVRDRMLHVVGLDVLLGLPSYHEAHETMLADVQRRRADHQRWLDELRASAALALQHPRARRAVVVKSGCEVLRGLWSPARLDPAHVDALAGPKAVRAEWRGQNARTTRCSTVSSGRRAARCRLRRRSGRAWRGRGRGRRWLRRVVIDAFGEPSHARDERHGRDGGGNRARREVSGDVIVPGLYIGRVR
jgi:chemotaxis signal transduction protein